MLSRIILLSIFTSIASPAGLASAADQEPTTVQLQRQLDEIRTQMVTMQNRLAELEAARRTGPTGSNTDSVLLETPSAQALRSQSDETKRREETTAFQFKGLTLTPGGFLEGTMLVRTRN